jgi:hypothetical protein
VARQRKDLSITKNYKMGRKKRRETEKALAVKSLMPDRANRAGAAPFQPLQGSAYYN